MFFKNKVPNSQSFFIPTEILNFLQQLFTALTFKFYDDFDREVIESSKVSVVKITPPRFDDNDSDEMIAMIIAGVGTRVNQQLQFYGLTADDFYFEKINVKYDFDERAGLFSFRVEGLFKPNKTTIEQSRIMYTNNNNNNQNDNGNRKDFNFGSY